MSERANPFGDLGDLAKTPAKPKPDPEQLEQVAKESGFVSRQPVKEAQTVSPAIAPAKAEKPTLPSRRRVTGRSEQVNIKTTFAAKKRLMEISVERNMPLGEILEQALELLEKSWAKDS
jgi:hypothetical protein